MANVNLLGFGHLNSVDVATSSTLSLTAHSGKVVNVTATSTLTLPAVATMHRYIVRVGANGITVTISPNAADLIAGAGAGSSGAGVDNKDVIFTNQPAGSYIVLAYGDANGWAIESSMGDFTFEA
jgi:hypothetical protein